MDHSVLLVGAGELDGKPMWTVRNSWGPNWGDKGDIHIYREPTTDKIAECGINLDAWEIN